VNEQQERELATKIGIAIATQRTKKGFTQEFVAEKLGLTKTQVSRLERAESLPTIRRIVEFAELFDCSTDELLSRSSGVLKDQEAILHTQFSMLKNKKERELVLSLVEQLCSHFNKK
jgi:transcriptional regulator with XRE-family HTH domain